MSVKRGRRMTTRLLFAVAVTAVLSHVCVLPHAHAGEAALAPHDHEESHDAAPHPDVHGASCEVLRSVPLQPPVVSATVETAVSLVERSAVVPLRASASTARGPSPPLFLLHASLLI